jgi:hypothetical protein
MLLHIVFEAAELFGLVAASKEMRNVALQKSVVANYDVSKILLRNKSLSCYSKYTHKQVLLSVMSLFIR